MVIYVWKYTYNSTSSTYSFNKIAVIDNAKSVIWASRFNTLGDFELYIAASQTVMDLFSQDDLFLTRDDSETVMYVEKVFLNTDDENGDFLTISGRSAECILGFRIIRRQVFSDPTTTADYIITYLVESFMPNAPNTSAWRKFPFLQVQKIGSDWDDLVQRQFTGKNLLTLISEVANEFNYGFKFIFDGTYLTFTLYKGTDRSYDQTENTHVIFSPEFENLGNTEYTIDKTNYANSAWIGGEGEGASRTIYGWYASGTSGLSVREIWVDARNVSSDTEQGTLTPEQYKQQLKGQAWEAVSQHKIITTFNGEILNYNNYTYGVDYNLGDKISIENEYGIRGNAQITGIIEVEDETGYRLVPTLSEWEVENATPDT